MSKGPGKVERAITALLDANPDGAFTTRELCQHVYGLKPHKVERRHRVSVLRAIGKVGGRRDTLGWMCPGTKAAFFNMLSLKSYISAKLKSRAYYHADDERLRKGGEWYRECKAKVEEWRAEIKATREGDTETLKKIEAAREARRKQNEMLLRAIDGRLGL